MTAMQFVRDMFLEADRQGIGSAVWDLLSALRGPDQPALSGEKNRYTLPVRDALDVFYGGGTIVDCRPSLASLKGIYKQAEELSIEDSEDEHYFGHICDALQVLINDMEADESASDSPLEGDLK